GGGAREGRGARGGSAERGRVQGSRRGEATRKNYDILSIMRNLISVALVALALSFVPSVRVGAWGFNGHKLIADRAIDLLPPEIRPFFQKYRTTVVEHAIDPDTYRTMGWSDEDPRHFLD